MNAIEAVAFLEDLEAAHCGEGAPEFIPGFPCLEGALDALMPALGINNADVVKARNNRS